MATVTGLTAERMLEIEAASIVDGEVVGDNLILTKHDATTINAGNVRGPQGIQGPTGDVSTASLNAAILAAIPIGVIWDYIESAPVANWLKMEGQTIVGGQTLYPLFWAKIPASMKSGSDIIMPDTRGRVSVGYNSADTDFDTIGEVGGAKTHTLTQSELPASPISIDPPSLNISIDPPLTNFTIDPPSFNATINPPSHTIAINPPLTTISIDPPATNTGGQSVSHSHTYSRTNESSGLAVVSGGPASTFVDDISLSTVSTGGASVDHVHAVNIPSFNATVDIASFNVAVDIPPFSNAIDPPSFTATVDIAPFTAPVDIPAFNSANLGSGEAHNNMQPYVVFLKMIKVA